MAFLLTLATNVQNTFRSRKRLSQFLLLSSLLLLSNAFLMAPNTPGRVGKDGEHKALEILLEGTSARGAFLPMGSQTFDTPGSTTFIVPAGVTCIDVQAWGAGGGGADRYRDLTIFTNRGSGGGGGGGFAGGKIPVCPGDVVNITVGAGGEGGDENNEPGLPGGNTVVSHPNGALTAQGGTGGQVSFFGGAGGVGGGSSVSGAVSSAVTFSGGDGGDGDDFQFFQDPPETNEGGGGGGGAGTTENGGDGEDGPTGDGLALGGAGGNAGGGNGGNGGNDGFGDDGQGYGGGGGGAGDANNGAGGNGADGAVIITWGTLTNPETPTVTAPAGTICEGDNVNLTISGLLNDADNWVVYEGSCDGALLGSTVTGTFTVNNIMASTTYYVRGEFNAPNEVCNECIPCAQVSVNVDPLPGPEFMANQTFVPVGSTVNFTNLSSGNPGSYTWTFEGGSPASSTDANPPAITYNTEGTFAVSLQATNSCGTVTETKTAYISVGPLTQIYETPGNYTFTVPNGVTCVNVEAWGGGGGGSTGSGSEMPEFGGGGGGGGGFAGGNLAVCPGEVINISVGGGGTGGSGDLNDGGDGENTIVSHSSDNITANGGAGGDASINGGSGGAGGIGSSTGSVNSFIAFLGGTGGEGEADEGGGGGGGAGNMNNGQIGGDAGSGAPPGGAGGDDFGGDGGNGGNNGSGGNGLGYGGGGGGSGDNSSGGNGGNGAVIISFCSDCNLPETPVVNAPPGPACPGDDVVLSISGQLNDAANWDVYTGSCGGTFVGSTIAPHTSFTLTNVVANTTTTYYVRASDVSANCDACRECGEAVVVVADDPAPCDISGSTTVCIGDDDVAYSAPVGFTGYEWSVTSGDAIIDGNDDTQSIAVDPGMNDFSLQVVVTDANGCTNTCTYNVSVIDIPDQPDPIVRTTTPPDPFCPGSVITYSVPNDPNVDAYIWSLPADWSGSSTTNSIDVTVNGKGTISVTPTNLCGSGPPRILNEEDPVPVSTATIEGTTTVCLGDPSPEITFTGSRLPPSIGFTFNYTINGNPQPPLTTIPPSFFSATVAAPTNSAGTFTYELVSVVDADGCSNPASGTATVTVSAPPVCDISGATTVCAGQQDIAYATTSGLADYAWSVTAGDANIDGPANGESINVDAGSANFSLQVIVTDAAGCTNTCTYNVSVIDVPAQPGAISGDNSPCEGDVVTYSVPNDPDATSYAWSLPAGWTGSSTSNSITVTVGANSGTVSVTPSNACGNGASRDLSVNLSPLPSATISGTTSVCQNDASPDITFTGSGGTTPYTFTYNINGGSNQSVTTSGMSSSVTVSAPTGTTGTFIYTLTAVEDANCENTASGTATVTVADPPVAGFTPPSPTVGVGDAVNFTDQSSGGSLTYSWTFAGGSPNTSTNPNPSVTYFATGTFGVTLTVSNGCDSDTQTGQVTVNAQTLVITTPGGPTTFIVPDGITCIQVEAWGGGGGGSDRFRGSGFIAPTFGGGGGGGGVLQEEF